MISAPQRNKMDSLNTMPTPTVTPTQSQSQRAFPVRRMRITRNETSAQLSVPQWSAPAGGR